MKDVVKPLVFSTEQKLLLIQADSGNTFTFQWKRVAVLLICTDLASPKIFHAFLILNILFNSLRIGHEYKFYCVFVVLLEDSHTFTELQIIVNITSNYDQFSKTNGDTKRAGKKLFQ